jgi:pyridoxamine 5'-phosphate oxidase
MTPSVIQLLRDALDLEFAERPRVAVLASVDADGRPRARSVIVRDVTDSGDLWVASDARSQKNAQLRQRPQADLVFWLPARREQFRVLCRARVIGAGEDEPRRRRAWLMLNDASRALFVWPAPGRPRGDCDLDFAAAVPAGDPIPDSFELLVLSAVEVDHLELGPFPHRRTRYGAQNAWQAEELNP